MIKLYESQEERNSFQKIFDAQRSIIVDEYDENKSLMIFVNEKSGIIKGYMYSEHLPVSTTHNDGLKEVNLGKVSKEDYQLAIMCVDDYLDSFPVYDFARKDMGLVFLAVNGVNCTLDDNSGKWKLNDGETSYKFYLIIEDPIDDIDHFSSAYVKQQDKNPETIKISGQKTSKKIIKNKSTFTIENLKGSEQTLKVKCSLNNESDIWLVKYITIM
jgi:hypothetical protein